MKQNLERASTSSHGMAWKHGMAWHGMAWHDMTWHGMAWHGMAWHGVAWKHGMAWHSMACHAMICTGPRKDKTKTKIVITKPEDFLPL